MWRAVAPRASAPECCPRTTSATPSGTRVGGTRRHPPIAEVETRSSLTTSSPRRSFVMGSSEPASRIPTPARTVGGTMEDQVTAHTGPSKRARAGSPPAKHPQIVISGVVHGLALAELRGTLAVWRCSCGKVFTVDARHREDGGAREALRKHEPEAAVRTRQRPPRRVPEARPMSGLRPSTQKRLADAEIQARRRARAVVAARDEPPRLISSRKRPGIASPKPVQEQRSSPPTNTRLLTKCPLCAADVRSRNLDRHLRKVHQKPTNDALSPLGPSRVSRSSSGAGGSGAGAKPS